MHEGAVDVASVRSRGCREQRHGKISVGNKGTRGFRAEPNTPNLTVTSVVVRGRGNNDRNRFKCDGDPDGHRISREKEHPRRVAVNRFSNKTEYTCFITECRPRHERLLRYVRPLRFDCQTRFPSFLCVRRQIPPESVPYFPRSLSNRSRSRVSQRRTAKSFGPTTRSD